MAVALAIIILTVIGLGVSAYLLYEHYVAPIACVGSGCALVDQSPYSEIYGLPLSAVGLASYALIFALEIASLWLWTGRSLSAYLQLGVFGLAWAGTIFSAYLTYIELEVIHAVCTWCVTSAVIIAFILLLSLSRLRTPLPLPLPRTP